MLEKYRGQKWVVGVSGGMDSMALLDMLNKTDVNIFVCHVNYHKRITSDYDENVVKEYCIKYGIPFYVAHAPTTAPYNFQAFARDFRYQFYRDILIKHQCIGVLLAHHKDDFLETALLRKKQGRNVDYLGIKASGYVQGLLVERPLLSLYKSDLAKYIKANKLVYGQDESNFDTHYERNKIRHVELAPLTKVEKDELYSKLVLCNVEKEKQMNGLKQAMLEHTLKDGLELNYLFSLTNEHKLMVLRLWLNMKHHDTFNVSDSFLKEICGFLASRKAISVMKIKDCLLVKEYGYLKIMEDKNYNFHYILEKIEVLDTPFFKITTSGSVREGITVSDDDFPLTIRNVKDGDKIHLKFGHKSVNRYFIDHKIPYLDRISCPIVVNQSNEVIFVGNLGSNISHFTNKPNLFVVK